jgi:hypothetical protein
MELEGSRRSEPRAPSEIPYRGYDRIRVDLSSDNGGALGDMGRRWVVARWRRSLGWKVGEAMVNTRKGCSFSLRRTRMVGPCGPPTHKQCLPYRLHELLLNLWTKC